MTVMRRLFASGETDSESDPDERGERVKAGIRIILLIVFLAMIANYSLPRERSFFISARTDILSVSTTKRPSEIWELADVSVCQPQAVSATTGIDLVGPSKDDWSNPAAFCVATGHELQKIEYLELSWPIETTLVIRMERGQKSTDGDGKENMIEVRVDGLGGGKAFDVDGIKISEGALLRFPARQLENLGVLRIAGNVRIGQTVTQGTRLMLRDGTFEIREILSRSRPPTLVSSGTLSLGEAVEIVTHSVEKQPVFSRAFISLAEGPRSSLRVVLTSEPAYSHLEKHRAYAVTSTIDTTWVQRVQADPRPVGIATLLSLLGGAIAVAQSFVQFRRRRKRGDNASRNN